MAIPQEFKFLNGPNGKLATLFHGTSDQNKAQIVMAHGFNPIITMTEHAKLFTQAAQAFHWNNIGSVMFDFTGNGMSDGYFRDLTPNRRIAELSFMLDEVTERFDGPVFLLGMSMGGAVSIHTAALKQQQLSGLITWSSVPSFDAQAKSATWFPKQADENSSSSVGAAFYTDKPESSVGDAYVSLTIPKLQIQGDQDYPHFADEFRVFFDAAPEPKEHVVIPGGNHVLDNRAVRNEAVARTVEWVKARCPV